MPADSQGATRSPISLSRRNTGTACDNRREVVTGDGGEYSAEEGVSPAQILVALIIAALVALVVVVALGRVI